MAELDKIIKHFDPDENEEIKELILKKWQEIDNFDGEIQNTLKFFKSSVYQNYSEMMSDLYLRYIPIYNIFKEVNLFKGTDKTMINQYDPCGDMNLGARKNIKELLQLAIDDLSEMDNPKKIPASPKKDAYKITSSRRDSKMSETSLSGLTNPTHPMHYFRESLSLK